MQEAFEYWMTLVGSWQERVTMLRVAVVGPGPNGLTAAARLAAAGQRVVVFEGQ